VLDADEHARANRFHFQRDATQYVVAHGLLRLLLARYTDTAPDVVRFTNGEFGKPILENTSVPLEFNLSHSGDLIALAFCANAPVGIDIEQWTDVEYDLVAETVFSDAERQALVRLAGYEKQAAFFACWTRKEAYIKATGVGVSQGLDYFDVSLLAADPARLIAERRPGHDATDWHMFDVPVPHGYSGALAVRDGDWSVSTRTLTPDDVPSR